MESKKPLKNATTNRIRFDYLHLIIIYFFENKSQHELQSLMFFKNILQRELIALLFHKIKRNMVV